MSFPNIPLAGSALPGKIVQWAPFYFDDFMVGGYGTTTGPKFASTANVADWLYTVNTGTPTFIISDAEPSGVVAMDVGAASDNHGFDAQLNGEPWSIRANRDLYFEIRWKSRTSVTDIDWVMGLTNTGTEIIDGTSSQITQALVFRSGAVDAAPLNAGNADIIATAADDVTSWTHANISEADTGINLVADTFVVLAMHLKVLNNGDKRAIFYVDGVNKFETTTNIPDVDTALTLSMSGQNNGSTNQFIMEVDYVLVAQSR